MMDDVEGNTIPPKVSNCIILLSLYVTTNETPSAVVFVSLSTNHVPRIKSFHLGHRHDSLLPTKLIFSITPCSSFSILVLSIFPIMRH